MKNFKKLMKSWANKLFNPLMYLDPSLCSRWYKYAPQKTLWWQEKWEVAGLLQPVSRSITDSNTPGGRSVCCLGKTVGFD